MSTPSTSASSSNPSSQAATPAASPASTDAGNTTTVSNDVFANPDVALLTVAPTSVGSDGIRRLTSPATDNWKPAPTELSKEDVKAAADREAYFEAAGKVTDNLA
jgi:hypothetical protein